MAVDANVLIYERIREELAKGKSLRGAINAGTPARSARFSIRTSPPSSRPSF
jgi:preprotein translocase subunit SecD